MTLLAREDLLAVSDVIRKAEQKTDAELVAVFARQADKYLFVSNLWAAVLALLSTLVLWLLLNEGVLAAREVSLPDIMRLQFAVFVCAALLLRLPVVLLLIVPPSLRNRRAADLARRQFLDNNLHHTRNETGVLIFVSDAECYAEIIVDNGIKKHIHSEHWQSLESELQLAMKDNKTAEGLVRCIQDCGELLAKYAPSTKAKNELPNHLVLI